MQDDAFTENFISTIGVDFKIKTLELEGKRVKLQIVSYRLSFELIILSGTQQDRNASRPLPPRTTGVLMDSSVGDILNSGGAHLLSLVVFDVTNRASFDNVQKWLDDVERHASQSIVKMLVGNKCNLEEKRQVEYHAAKSLADSLNMPYIETR